MKVSVKWLSEYLEPVKKDKKLSIKMTALGLEVSKIYQSKSDQIIDIEMTPNRGDCLSIYGIARDLKSLYKSKLKPITKQILINKPNVNKNIGNINHTISPIYSCLEIKNINNKLSTPKIIKQRLKDYGISSVNLIVDILNYTMIEVGQPFHAFDLNTLDGPISVRFSKKGESIDALNGIKYKLTSKTPVIVDSSNIQAIAGLIGSQKSAITKKTNHILIECAYFLPDLIRKSSKTYKLQTDSSYRFERGVNPFSHHIVLERVLNLLSKYSNYDSYKYYTKKNIKKINKPRLVISTSIDSFIKLLGMPIKMNTIKKILTDLNFLVKNNGKKIHVQVPDYRFDITNEYDLFEEIARVVGYENFDSIKLPPLQNNFLFKSSTENSISNSLVIKGYKEVINFAFLPKSYETIFYKKNRIVSINNPISEDKSDMRVSLIPSLVKSYKYNFSRQNTSMKIFETGKVYWKYKNTISELQTVSALISGDNSMYSLKEDSIKYNFFDLKGDLLSILPGDIEFKNIKGNKNDYLSENCQAVIFYNKKEIGYCGEISDKIYQVESLKSPIYVFEIFTQDVEFDEAIKYREISPFPKIKRDLTFIINNNITSDEILKTIERLRVKYLINIRITDIFYDSKEFSENEKSISFEIIFQDMNITLKDSQITTQIDTIVNAMMKAYKARLRDK
ncbi:MAG: phenylalanine--tRNA ligase subunit beta [Gammaproteobacteria bacterium]|nr:phenylalanine--tRNA ligase subunit beta [Gammaproteobacteria bacterium]|tara:strand:- start:521 stop:2554 length:2034 start_codon:yes stop_codon:yes gene_type:complete